MFLGIFLGNRTRETEEQLHALEPIEMILFTCFFTMAGVSLHLDELGRMGLMGGAFVIVRFAGKGIGALVGGVISGSSPRIRKNIPLGLVPQAGLAIALVILLQGDARIPAEIRSLATTMVLAAVVVNEIAGPFFARAALRGAKEINKDRPRLMEFLQEEYIKTDLKAKDKWEAIEQLCDFLIRTHRIRSVNRETLLKTFIERERLQSTSVGVETAITHGRIGSGPSIQGVLGICPDGVDFDTPDGLPVRIIMMIVTPKDHETRHLEVLASLAGMISDERIRERLKAARNANEAWEIIESEETHDYNYFLED
jgi:mannitol/fructose-specific phosphotransferase system IIA component (Ntr-type)